VRDKPLFLLRSYLLSQFHKRELAAINLEQRKTIQQLELKMLDLADLPSGKRKDLVFRTLTVKEDELQDLRRETKFLRNELDQLTDLNAVFAANVMHRRLPGQQQSLGTGQIDSVMPTSVSPSSQHVRYNPTSGPLRASPTVKIVPPHQAQRAAFMVGDVNSMSPDEAKLVIFNELRRLKESYSVLFQERDKLQEKVSRRLLLDVFA
jgi:hypothetical protein